MACESRTCKFDRLRGDVEMEARIALTGRRQIQDCVSRLEGQHIVGTKVRERTDVMYFDPDAKTQYSITTNGGRETFGARSKTEGERIVVDGIDILVRNEVSLRDGQEGYQDTVLKALRSVRLGEISKNCVDVVFRTRDKVFCVTFSCVTDRETKEQLHQIEVELKGLRRGRKRDCVTPEDLLGGFSDAFFTVLGRDAARSQDHQTKLSWLSELRGKRSLYAPEKERVSMERSKLLHLACSL